MFVRKTVLFFALFIFGCASEKPESDKVSVSAMLSNGSAPTSDFQVMNGDIKVKLAETGETVRAVTVNKIKPGDTIITGKNSRTKIVMPDQNEIHVAPDSKVQVQKYEAKPEEGKANVLLKLLNGKVRANVKQKYDGKDKVFQIQTKTAVAGVRGTEFTADYDEASDQSKIVAFDGTVEFGQPGPNDSIVNSVKVEPGHASVAEAGKAPAAPIEVPKEELKVLDKESNIEAPPKPQSGAASELPKIENAVDPKVSLGWLKNGNIRFVKKHFRADGASKADLARTAAGEKPHAIIFTCSDSRFAPETVFDEKIGEIVVISNRTGALDTTAIASIELAVVDTPARMIVALGEASCFNSQGFAELLKTKSALLVQAIDKGELVIQEAMYDLKTGVVQFQ